MMACLTALLSLTWACGDEVIIQPAPEDNNDVNNDVNNAPNNDPNNAPDGGTPDVFEPEDEPPDFDVVEAPDCSNYTYRGQIYNCDTLDLCSPDEDIQKRLACCECDPNFCNPQGACSECGNGTCELGENTANCPADCPADAPVESCMSCHNGAVGANNYSGPGLSNPHPFPGADNITCTGCHGGNPRGSGRFGSHVPPPPSIGNKQNLAVDQQAYFNRNTMAGLDKLQPETYTSPDRPNESFTNLEYIQFLNPGDLRVVTSGAGCGAQGCHFDEHAQWVPRSNIATTNGIFSASRFVAGVENRIQEYRGRNQSGDSLSDSAPRSVRNPAFNQANAEIGEVGRLVEQPELAAFNGPMRDNGVYDATALANHVINNNQDQARPNRIREGSPLEHLYDEQVSITCGDCHLYSAGANNRYADFRSSGCTACHMEYSYDGRSRSGDPNVNRNEPANPDAIAAPERAHVEAHQIRNVARFLGNGAFVRGISDRACVGCHQGSNRTVLQFWGVRLDQNQDLTNNFQYPANPANFTDAANDERLYDPGVNNATFNGRVAQQHILFEDYDDDGRDDTPPDIHYETGMGCIDCHGSYDLHGGTKGQVLSGKVRSRMDQAVAIQCESCHGTVGAYAEYTECTNYNGQRADCVVDSKGNPLRHVTRDPNNNYFLVSRLNGQRHYIPQTRDTVVNTNKQNPLTQRLIYNPKASYAMGRADGNPQTGTGPLQENPNLVQNGFSHTDTMDCVSCHASWTNNCIGCHLANQYDVNPQNYFFSNITGERILLFQAAADFVYQTPVPFYMGVNSRGKITQIGTHEKVFYRYIDLNGNESAVLAFSDRLGEGNNPITGGRNAFPALSQNQMSPHSIRGKVTADKEGPRYCVGCHLNTQAINDFGADYDAFLAAYANNDFANLDFELLQQVIGQNTGNQLNHPIFVHMAAGLGSGLFLFDETGCPVNPLDANANRQYCPDGAPADNFDANNVVYDLDRLVEFNGIPNAGGAHPRTKLQGAQRIGASNGEMGGPLGAQTLQKLADPNVGRVLDSWIDANGNAQGGAANFIQ